MGFRGSRVQIPPSRFALRAERGGDSVRRDFANAARSTRGFLSNPANGEARGDPCAVISQTPLVLLAAFCQIQCLDLLTLTPNEKTNVAATQTGWPFFFRARGFD